MNNQKVAILTGATRGMGAACAKHLAEKGYQLALLSPSGESELAAKFPVITLQGSVTHPSDLEKLVQTTLKQYGRIDAVVNSTGHPPKGNLLALSDAEWLAGLDLVLLNVIRLARLVTPIMQKQKSGSIVNISTFAAVEPDSNFPVSTTFRAGLSAFTKLFADEYASQGIRMNNVLPGFIDSYAVDENTIKKIPMQRAGTTDEIAQTVGFLLSDAASYITGQNIRVDGGLTRSL